jgi:hypothetical protein
MQVKTYDVVYDEIHTMSYVRHTRSYARTTSYVTISYVPDVRYLYTMSYVHHVVRHRTGTTSYGYDVVRAPRTTQASHGTTVTSESCATSVLYRDDVVLLPSGRLRYYDIIVSL